MSGPLARTVSHMRLYNELASWWPLLSTPDDYLEEAQFFRDTILANCTTTPTTVLELGSGGGNNASHMKSTFTLTLVDISEQMLNVSRNLNPQCEHIQGDMRTLRLGKTFDAVFVHDAITYMTSAQDLRRAIETAFIHCKDGGMALLVPDHTRETFASATSHGGHDDDQRGLRYLSWDFDPDPSDTTTSEYFSIILRDSDGSVTFEHEQHTAGLFGRDDWNRMMVEVGFEPKRITEPYGRDAFIAKKPSR
jgi:ubiquinone/menaquinone biosynthesis C-methylase UbiE